VIVDLLHLDGVDLTRQPLLHRKQAPDGLGLGRAGLDREPLVSERMSCDTLAPRMGKEWSQR
jgi:hypothetical protein